MSKKTLGIVLIVVGIVAVVMSLGADALGIGAAPGIGWKQALGAVVGVIIVAVGAWFWPGFPQSRLLGDAAAKVPAASRTPQKAEGSQGRSKPRTAKSPSRSVRKGTEPGSRRRGKK